MYLSRYIYIWTIKISFCFKGIASMKHLIRFRKQLTPLRYSYRLLKARSNQSSFESKLGNTQWVHWYNLESWCFWAVNIKCNNIPTYNTYVPNCSFFFLVNNLASKLYSFLYSPDLLKEKKASSYLVWK